MKKISGVSIFLFLCAAAFSQQQMPGNYIFSGQSTFSSLHLAPPQRPTNDSLAIATIDRNGKIGLGPGTYLQVARVLLSKNQIDSLHIYAAVGGYPLIPAPGVGKYLEIYSIAAKIIFNTKPYSGFCTLSFMEGAKPQGYTIATDECCTGGLGSELLNESRSTRLLTFKLNQGKPAQQISENAPLTVVAEHESPADGDSAVEFIITYAVVSLQ